MEIRNLASHRLANLIQCYLFNSVVLIDDSYFFTQTFPITMPRKCVTLSRHHCDAGLLNNVI